MRGKRPPRRAALLLTAFALACEAATLVVPGPDAEGRDRAAPEAEGPILLMVPGINATDTSVAEHFLEPLRRQGGYATALFYRWEAGDPGRRIVAAATTDAAAEKLVALCAQLQRGDPQARPLDILAHSAGTIVVNKTAELVPARAPGLRFRHVLFLGTALAHDESLAALLAISDGLLNVHSAFDKVNRTINRAQGRLEALPGGAYRNLRRDTTLSGRLVRHAVLVAPDPENWVCYGRYLQAGRWPEPSGASLTSGRDPAALHAATLSALPDPVPPGPRARSVAELLDSGDPVEAYYGAILAGRLDRDDLVPRLKRIAENEATPVYVRKEAYQALGNLRDGAQIRYLQAARDRDPACAEELRDLLRALKRERVVPPRGR